jgi:hypothetical protein
MRALACCLLLALTCLPACAQEPDQPWRWYFVAFDSPSPGSDAFVRSGTARVVLDDSKVRIEFVEKGMPELKATYAGSLAKGGNVKGALDGFFFHGPEAWGGTYSQTNLNECRFEEIVLRSGVPDGSALVLSRAQGKCQ